MFIPFTVDDDLVEENLSLPLAYYASSWITEALLAELQELNTAVV